MKILLVILDGLGDRPVKEFGGLTPLEKAKTPNLNKLAKNGITGLMDTIGRGVRPGSDTAHLSILGFPPEKYYAGRGLFEVLGIGMNPKKGDVCFRANLATVDKGGKIIDRRAGRIGDTSPYAKKLDGIAINGIKFMVQPGTAHRMGIIARGKGLSGDVADNDPHIAGENVLAVRPTKNTRQAKFTAKVMNNFLAKARDVVSKNPENAKRKKSGKLIPNYVLIRGAAFVPKLESFEKKFGLKAGCIAGGGLYRGVARFLGMDLIDVKGATGTPATNAGAKFREAKKALNKYDFIFLHVKGTDSLGEDGNCRGKMKFIEKDDLAIGELRGLKNTVIAVTGDHSTPCSLKAHSGDPLPILINGPGVRVDAVKEFGERACASGGLQRINGRDLVPELINIAGKAILYGD
ncbi:MAG: 2,3-bisphosphoglycerate-independent phosphoglycerate mutase [Candidatus Diapherotrites archaeon]